MHGKAFISDPAGTDVTITATMTLEEWRNVTEHLRGHSYQFSKLIQDLVAKATHECFTSIEKK